MPLPLKPRSTSRRSPFRPIAISLASIALLLAAGPLVNAQLDRTTNPPRITQAIEDSVLTTLKGNVHPLARAQYDQGPASSALPMKRMLMVLKRGDVQEAALKTFMDQQQDKHSASYQQWLTPTQLGESYGPNPDDIRAVTGWLQSYGFEIGEVAKSGMFIEFSGTAGQVQRAFHTEIHSYLVNGSVRHANSSDPQIPSALAPVVAGLDSLNSFPKKPASHMMGTFKRDKGTGKIVPVSGTKPSFTFPTSNGDLYLVAPYDLATIYNVQALWNANLDGSGQTVAIVGETDIDLADVRNFRSLFGLPARDPVVIVNGIDPGFQEDEGEADIDVQWSGAIAKGATIDFVTSASTESTYGTDLSALYIIENNLAPVMSLSYGECELALGTGGNQFYNALWQQAAAQGISAFVSSGDEGSASCDADSSSGARYGYTVSGYSSTPYNVSAGGTDFDQFGDATTYWTSINNPTTQASAKGYIPETPWNNSCTNAIFSEVTGVTDPLTNCNNVKVIGPDGYGGLDITGGSGGPSTCIVSDGQNPSSCAGGYAKPSWQVGTFADKVRDTPDISLFASNGFANSFYPYCEQDANTPAGAACSLSSGDTFQGAGGTSFVSPILAGLFAILNQKTGSRVGNPNYNLYNLAAKESAASCNSTTGPASSCIFNDVTKGTISQACQAGSVDCYSKAGESYGVLVDDNGAGYGKIDSSGYPSDLAFNTAVGYDYATGLGTVNTYNLVEQWSSADFLASATTLSLSSTSFAHGTPVTATVTVTSNTGTPSGNVSINGATPNGSVGDATLSAGKVNVIVKALPGGSYNVIAHYGGNNDGTNLFAGSDSNPVAVTISPEASTTTVSTALYNVTNGDYTYGTTATYGAYYVVPRVDIAGASGNGVATGTVALTANGTALTGSPFALNSTGDTEDQNFAGNAGTYAFSASYSGDPSFTASAGASTLTITQATPTSTLSAVPASGAAGTVVTLNTVLDTKTYVGTGPTGTVSFYAGTTALGAPVAVTSGTDTNGFPEATATLATTAIPAGTNSVTAKYSGDTNYAAVTSPAVTVTITGTTPTLAISGTSIGTFTAGGSGTSTVTVTPGGGFTGGVNLTCSVTGPTGATSVPTCSYNPASVTISGATAGTSTLTVATTSTTTAGSYTVTITATSGTVTNSNTLPFTVNAVLAPATIALTPVPTAVTISSPGQSGTSTVSVTPMNYTGTLNLTCALATSPSGANSAYNPACAVPSTLSISAAGVTTATASFTTTAPTSGALVYPETNRKSNHWYMAAGGAALACVLFFGIPARRRGWKSMLGLLVFIVAMAGAGCGGGGGGNNNSGTPGTTTGAYTFTVTATDSKTATITATGTINVTVN